MTSTHALKTWPLFFKAVLSEDKRHELRKWDREFSVGDVLRLREWDPDHQSPELEIYLAIPEEDRDDAEDPRYTGRDVFVKVTYVTPRGVFGMPEHLCVMSIARLASTDMGRRHSSTKRMAAVVEPIMPSAIAPSMITPSGFTPPTPPAPSVLSEAQLLCVCRHARIFHRDNENECTMCDDCLHFDPAWRNEP